MRKVDARPRYNVRHFAALCRKSARAYRPQPIPQRIGIQNNMTKPLISVVLAVGDAAGDPTPAAESVFKQTFRPLELIIVDGGSTGVTAQRIDALAAKSLPGVSVRLITQQNGTAAE